jgi:uncharacterized membrane protein
MPRILRDDRFERPQYRTEASVDHPRSVYATFRKSMAAAAPAVIPSTLQSEKRRDRLDSVDLLRGFVMVVMALDHVRDFVSNAHFDPADVSKTTPALFFTRWITHYCAPTFVFLAGTGAFISMSRGKPKKDLARFLLTRGAWLIFLEATVVKFGWSYALAPFFGLQVIWVLGWCMMLMAGIIFLPRRAIAALGIAIIVLHNLLDGIHAKSFGAWAPLWNFLHQFGVIKLGPATVIIVYPLIPWIGVMAAGYAFGELLIVDAKKRVRRLFLLGGALTFAFVVLRFAAFYGDPHPWRPLETPAKTIMSFFACEKYPPSLLYLLMTLGPGIMALGAFESVKGAIAKPFIVFGRVPMFYYLLHLYVIHLLTIALALFLFPSAVSQVLDGPFAESFPDSYGLRLPGVYAMWILAILLLYPACKWFAGVKERRRDPWLSYL